MSPWLRATCSREKIIAVVPCWIMPSCDSSPDVRPDEGQCIIAHDMCHQTDNRWQPIGWYVLKYIFANNDIYGTRREAPAHFW